MLTFTLPLPRVVPNEAQREASFAAAASCCWACSFAKARASSGTSLGGTAGGSTGLGDSAAAESFVASVAVADTLETPEGAAAGCFSSRSLLAGSDEGAPPHDGSSLASAGSRGGGALRPVLPPAWEVGFGAGGGWSRRCGTGEGSDGRAGGGGLTASGVTDGGAFLLSPGGSGLAVSPMEGTLGTGVTLGDGFDSRAVRSTRLDGSGGSARAANSGSSTPPLRIKRCASNTPPITTAASANRRLPRGRWGVPVMAPGGTEIELGFCAGVSSLLGTRRGAPINVGLRDSLLFRGLEPGAPGTLGRPAPSASCGDELPGGTETRRFKSGGAERPVCVIVRPCPGLDSRSLRPLALPLLDLPWFGLLLPDLPRDLRVTNAAADAVSSTTGGNDAMRSLGKLEVRPSVGAAVPLEKPGWVSVLSARGAAKEERASSPAGGTESLDGALGDASAEGFAPTV
jgi:hypothetical protein